MLDPADPPAAEIVLAAGPAPLLLVCDHARNRVPRVLGDLGIAPGDLDRHIGWDIGAEAVARALARHLGAPLILSGYSRLVIDCNRRLDDPTSIPATSDGTAIPANARLTAAERRARAEACFFPYHRLIEAHLDARAAQRPVLLSIHSFTPSLGGAVRPWHVGVLWNEDDRLALPLMAALASEGDLVVGDNEPYSGRVGQGYTMPIHAEARGLAHALIEIRQDLIANATGAEAWAARLARVLAPILAGCAR